MDKMKMAHEMALAMAADGNVPNENIVTIVWQYADAMQAEAEKREKAEAEQKRKEMREMLNAPNTFVEREGQHFDDVNWQPDWSQAPDDVDYWRLSEIRGAEWVSVEDGVAWYKPAPLFDYQGDWRDSLRKRPE